MQLIEYFLTGIQYLAYTYFAVSALYVFVFASAGHLFRNKKTISTDVQRKFAILIPAYKEDLVIVSAANSALKQNYKTQNFDVVVIADSLSSKTINCLKELPIKLIEVSFKESTKAKALNLAMNELKEIYQYAVVLDADNIMEADFLKKMNAAFLNGFDAVQGHRKAKNKNTSFAILDAASEEINNHIFRKSHRSLGFPSGLIGSGMAFNYGLFKSTMKSVTAVGGFDKELEFEFAKKGYTIEYLEDAIVLDEKIQKVSAFSNQRRRWLSTQVVFLKKYFLSGCKEFVMKGNINFFDKLFQMILPPRILLLGTTFLSTLFYGLLFFGFGLTSKVFFNLWLLNLLVVVITFFLALPKSFYNKYTLRAMFSLPSAFFRMAFLLLKLRGANKEFIHTAHGAIKN